MLFNSYIFVLLFLPIVLAGWFQLNKYSRYKLAEAFLLGMSLWFYGYFNFNYLLIIITSIFANYGAYKALSRCRLCTQRKFIFFSGLSFNLGILFYFKYFDFFLENINAAFQASFPLRHILLPLGISFYTFQQLSFLIDCYKQEVPEYSFLQYAVYVTYFPQLIAGPIVTHDEFIPQLNNMANRRLNWEGLAKGLYLFTLGLAKKVLIADTFGNAVNWGYATVASLDSINAFLLMLSYTIQIYFDFSGYCDMALGIGQMMNFKLPVNFSSPYQSLTVTEFWDRWHMTLTRFFTRYIYIPLGGSKKGACRTYLNTMAVFLLSGLWHGANWTFILWGACNGIFIVASKHWKNFFYKLHPALNWLVTFGFVNVMWVLFRASSIQEALQVIKKIAMLQFSGIRPEFTNTFNLTEFRMVLSLLHLDILNRYPYFFMVGFFLVAFLLLFSNKNAPEHAAAFQPTAGKCFFTVALLVWCIFSFSGLSTFLYFNF